MVSVCSRECDLTAVFNVQYLFGHAPQRTFAQKHKQIAKVCWKLCYLKIDLQTIANDIIFCESGNISPFLVTLVAATTGASNQKKFRLWKKKLSMAALRMKKEKTK